MAGGTWDKLEQVFEERVARALSKLGVHTQSDVERLAERVDALAEAVNALLKSEGRAPMAAGKPTRRGAKRAAKKRAVPAPEAPAAGPVPKQRARPRKTVKRKAA